MFTRAIALLAALSLSATGIAYADSNAANACAAKLPRDAKLIYDATLPQLTPGANLRDLVANNTRRLARAGTIDRNSARNSAMSAGSCLRQAGT